jgi:hypothetical protein
MFSDRYRGLRIAVSDAAMRELMKEGKSLSDVVDILEHGRDAPRKRKTGIIEKWLDKGAKTYCAVVARDYNEVLHEDVLLLIHYGRFSRRRKR